MDIMLGLGVALIGMVAVFLFLIALVLAMLVLCKATSVLMPASRTQESARSRAVAAAVAFHHRVQERFRA